MESNLIIYNASAGSGKTFTLVVEYVNLLIDTNIKKNIIDIEKILIMVILCKESPH